MPGRDLPPSKETRAFGDLEDAAVRRLGGTTSQGASSCGQHFEIGQVTVRLPLDRRPLPSLALVLSFVPWIVPAVLLAHAAATRNYFTTFASVLILLAAGLCEFILKPLIHQPRPATTACRYPDGSLKPGMPSGHMLTSQSVAVWLALEAALELDPAHATAAIVALLALSGACGWARWYNGDHTAAQVLVSAALGVVLAFIALAVDRCLFTDQMRQSSGSGFWSQFGHLDNSFPDLDISSPGAAPRAASSAFLGVD